MDKSPSMGIPSRAGIPRLHDKTRNTARISGGKAVS
jgi:hypothetical protein